MTSKNYSRFAVVAAILFIAAGCSSNDDSRGGSADSKLIGQPPSCDGIPTPLCAAGTKLVDRNGDGCEDACEPVACTPVVTTCPPGQRVADTNGDGCAMECI